MQLNFGSLLKNIMDSTKKKILRKAIPKVSLLELENKGITTLSGFDKGRGFKMGKRFRFFSWSYKAKTFDILGQIINTSPVIIKLV